MALTASVSDASSHDALGQRTYKQRSGVAFSGPYYETYAYDDRSELQHAHYFAGTYGGGTPDPNQDHLYSYDCQGAPKPSHSEAPENQPP